MKPIFRKFSFREYQHDSNMCPVMIVTPDDGNYMHTFFDVDPISPSGTYLACIKLPFVDRLPKSEDAATVCIINLKTQEIADVYQTKGWGLCVGAHVCWGKSDNQLLFNDKEDGSVFSIEYHLESGTTRKLCHEFYQVTRDGRWGFGPSLALLNNVQKGYGVTLDDKFDITPTSSLADDEGLWRLDIENNSAHLILTKKDVFNLLPDKKPFENCEMVFFHTKISPNQKRLMQMIRCKTPESNDATGRTGQLRFIVTCDLDGGNAKIALPFELWGPDSHHPDWYPDSEWITMNLRFNGYLRFVKFKQDGSSLQIMYPHLPGSGHPSTSKNLRWFMTDTYPYENFANHDKEIPIRLINSQTGEDRNILYIWSLSAEVPFDFRNDLHPVWNQDDTKIVFNGVVNDKRQVLIADVKDLVK